MVSVDMPRCGKKSVICILVFLLASFYFVQYSPVQSDVTVPTIVQEEHQQKWKGNNISRLSNLPPALYYCNSPNTLEAFLTDEGKSSRNWALKQVQIVIRHGDRTPLNFDLYSAKNIHPNFCNVYNDDVKKESLLGKYRDDMATYKVSLEKNISGKLRKILRYAVPYLSVCSQGQLTQFGVLQHLHNGYLLRDIYLHKHKLYLEEDLSNKVKVFTTSYSRTYQSALAFLYGLIPNYRSRKISFRVTMNLLFCGSKCACPFANGAMQKEIDSRKYKLYLERQKKNATVIKLASMLSISDRTGIQMDRLVTGFLCKGLRLPCSDDTCVTKDDLDVVMREQEHMNKILFTESPLRNRSMLLMQPLLESISKRMEEAVKESKNAAKVFLYSGHDSTLRPLLEALGIPEHRWPRLASRLVFELWQSRDNHYVKVLFNGVDVTSDTSFCSSYAVNGACPYTKFKDFSTLDIARHFNVDTRDNACFNVHQ